MKNLTLSFTIIIKGCMTKNMTPEQIAEQLNEHVQHEVKNLNIPAVMVELACPRCGSTNTAPSDKDNDAECYDCGFVWQERKK